MVFAVPFHEAGVVGRRLARQSALLACTAVLCLLASGCGPSQLGNCGAGQADCGDGCADIESDPYNCGGCGIICDAAAGETCFEGQCRFGAEPCEPLSTEPCYTGPVGTEDVGECRSGTHTCLEDGFGFGPCQGQITPEAEVCDNGMDEDCDGTPDDDEDLDGDGYTACGGDCCDSTGDGCTEPTLVNPGAFEVAGNELDDDCDGTIDNQVTACDTGLPSDSGDPLQYAAAIDLCQTTEENAPPEERRWGVISGEFTLASGNGNPSSSARSIRPGFGGTAIQFGESLVVLSTGRAAAAGDTNPAFAPFQGGQNLGTTSTVPGDWLSANGNNFPNAPGCPEPQGGTTANDSIMLTLRVRVPTNALSFSLSSNFFSAEYPEWVCSPFNDFFLVLLDSAFSGSPPNPPDKNLARYTAPDSSIYPVGVNLAFGNTGLFSVCMNGPTGCGQSAVPGNCTTCTGTAELAGTGFDIANPPTQFDGEPAWCGNSNLAGGGTGWLSTSGNVDPGEIIELRFVVWDTGDPWYDSVVLLDNFQWSVEASEPGTVID